MHKCELCNIEIKRKDHFESHNKTIDHRIKNEEIINFTVYAFYHNGILLYIGSSYDSEKRLLDHRSHCFNANSEKYNFKFYKYIRDNNLTFDNLEHKILHTFAIDSKNKTKHEMLKDAHIQEQKYIDMLKPLCNQLKAFTGLNQSDYHKKRNKQYYQDNKDEINKKINCNLCNQLISKNHMKRHQKQTICKQKQPPPQQPIIINININIKKQVIITKKNEQ